jgi:hypothetical protein
MDTLGVPRHAARRCAANMHAIAVSYVDKIMTTKWQWVAVGGSGSKNGNAKVELGDKPRTRQASCLACHCSTNGRGMGPGLAPYVPIPFLNPLPVHWR